MNEQLEFLRNIAEKLESCDIPYMLTGSIFMNETSQKVESIYREKILALSPEERLMMACRMFDEAKELVLAGIRADHPGLNEQETRIKLFTRFYGNDFEPEQIKSIIAGIIDA